jgi:hypothetical protein
MADQDEDYSSLPITERATHKVISSVAIKLNFNLVTN